VTGACRRATLSLGRGAVTRPAEPQGDIRAPDTPVNGGPWPSPAQEWKLSVTYSSSLRRLSLAACFSAAIAGGVAAQDDSAEATMEMPSLDTVVATVNGTEITLAHVINARREVPEQYQQLPDEVLFEGIIDQLIQQEVLSQNAGDAPFWLDTAVENERRQLRAGLIIEDVLRRGISESDIQAAYDAQFAGVEEELEYNASHILVETEEEAAALVTELAEGGDFAALAQEHSTGPSGPGGGSLGWFGAGQMVAPFEEAVMALEVGAVSDPVQTQFGWHVIKLDDTRPRARPTLDQLRGQIIRQLETAAVEAEVTKLESEADITVSFDQIDPGVLTNLSLFGEDQ